MKKSTNPQAAVRSAPRTLGALESPAVLEARVDVRVPGIGGRRPANC